MTTDIKQVAKMEYQERMKQRLAGAPMPLEILMQSSAPITQQQLDAIAKKPENYENRERIPEPLLVYADLYHELTGQEPNRRTFTDFIDTFWAWKDLQLQPEHIRMAWAQAQSDKGFLVGRPGALTITATGCKSKAKPAMPEINKAEVERTKVMLEQKNTGTFVPRPANVARPRIGQPK